MRATWAKADGTAGDAKLAETERSAAVEAVKAERRAAVVKARHAVADAELKLGRAAADKKEALGKELSASRELLTKAEQKAPRQLSPPPTSILASSAQSGRPRVFFRRLADDPQVEFPPQSTGRRSALAAWITDPHNPLTARVAVNQIWMRHMGTPLVATVFDFGRKGSQPTHPELLDWLAAELIDSGWDMKHLHRLIVLSSAYRMSSSSAHSDANVAKDPDNLHLWRRSPMRLESEAVRDSILSLAGTLDLTRGGPPVLPAAQADSTRRSLYFFHSNNDRNLFLSTFDEAAVKECYRRDQSIVPQQALALADSRLVHDAARTDCEASLAAGGIWNVPANDQEFVQTSLLCAAWHARERRANLARAKMQSTEWRTQPDAAGRCRRSTAPVSILSGLC